jgi:hypothetical protein
MAKPKVLGQGELHTIKALLDLILEERSVCVYLPGEGTQWVNRLTNQVYETREEAIQHLFDKRIMLT